MKLPLVAAICLSSLIAASPAPRRVYPERWVYGVGSLDSDRDLEEVLAVVRTAAAHGLNGLVLTGLDRLDLQPPQYLERLKKLKTECDRNHIEIVPSGFNVGYGGGLLSHDPNLAAALPVKDALFVVHHGEAKLVPDPAPRILNGGLESHAGDRAADYTAQAEPGKLTFIDTDVFHEGRASVRFENFGPPRDGSARIEQSVAVKPYRCYRVRAWIRTQGVAPATLFSIRAYSPDRKRNFSWYEPALAATSEWQEVTAGFNSWFADRVTLSLGIEEGAAGKLWLDDIRIEEVGLLNVVRREGTPVRVRGEKSGTVHEEGRDYARITDPKTDFWFNREGPAIHLPAGSRIREGERLRVDYYHGITIYRDQVGACMSDPKVFAIWRKVFPLIEQQLAPKKWLLALDEVRTGGLCETCRKRNLSTAAMLGDYATQLHRLIRAGNPQAEIYVWSDMFDPNHNSVPDYYLLAGDPTGSWRYLPKDMGIACWYFEKRRESLDHFSKLGFRTLAGAYYDADDLKNPEGWLDALDETPGAVGIMYTTWSKKFGLLGAFGDLLLNRK